MKHSVNLVTLLLLTMAGCTWVKPTPDAERIRIVPSDRVADCKKQGELSAYTKASVGGVLRKEAKVKSELETLARIEASEMGADTIITASEIKDGHQTYIAFKCQ